MAATAGRAAAVAASRSACNSFRLPAIWAVNGRRSAPCPAFSHPPWAIREATGSVPAGKLFPLQRSCRTYQTSYAVLAVGSLPGTSDWLERLENIDEDPAPQRMRQRPSKNRAKRNAHWSQDIAHRLSEMSENQLSQVAPMLDEYIIEEVKISSRIPGKNQGRRRQEGLIAKMLRNYPGLDLEELEAAIEGQGVSSKVDSDVERRALAWRESLLEGDEDTEQLALEAAVRNGRDPQHLRALVNMARKEAARQNDLEDLLSATLQPAKAKKKPNKQGKILLRELRGIIECDMAGNA